VTVSHALRGILADKIETDLRTPCHFPAIGTTVRVEAGGPVPAALSRALVRDAVRSDGVVDGVLMAGPDSRLHILAPLAAVHALGQHVHRLEFVVELALTPSLTAITAIATAIGM